MSLEILTLQPRHKWFSSSSREADSWNGPYATFERAVFEEAREMIAPYPPIFVTQGFKLTKAMREDFCSEHEWEVDAKNAVEVRLPASEEVRA